MEVFVGTRGIYVQNYGGYLLMTEGFVISCDEVPTPGETRSHLILIGDHVLEANSA